MINIQEVEFEGLMCNSLENKILKIWVTRDVGPRILGLSIQGGKNLLAVLPGAKIVVDGADDFSLRGGHRLWYGPENPGITYVADDQPLEIISIENGLQFIQNVDQATGIMKSWKVVIDEVNPALTINHRLTNRGKSDFELAPWAITQLRKGGTAILPLNPMLEDIHGLQPNRQIIFWPYTQIDSPFLKLKNEAVQVEAKLLKGALKVGAPNPSEWLAYVIDQVLFVKKAKFQASAKYPDRGASSQIYCNQDFIELETLGPMVNLAPGESVEHLETWQIYQEGNWPEEIGDIFHN